MSGRSYPSMKLLAFSSLFALLLAGCASADDDSDRESDEAAEVVATPPDAASSGGCLAFLAYNSCKCVDGVATSDPLPAHCSEERREQARASCEAVNPCAR